MSRNRITIPNIPAPAPSPDAFVQIHLNQLPTLTPEQIAQQKALYEWAFAEAQAVVKPAIVELNLSDLWN
jgi:hypothetical protein